MGRSESMVGAHEHWLFSNAACPILYYHVYVGSAVLQLIQCQFSTFPGVVSRDWTSESFTHLVSLDQNMLALCCPPAL